MDETTTDTNSHAIETYTSLRPVDDSTPDNPVTENTTDGYLSTFVSTDSAYRQRIEDLMSTMASTVITSNRPIGTLDADIVRMPRPYTRVGLTGRRFNVEPPIMPPPPLERIRTRPEQETRLDDYDGDYIGNLRADVLTNTGNFSMDTRPVSVREEGSINRDWTTTISRDSIYGSWTINEGNLQVKSDSPSSFEQNLIKFLKEKLSINISVNNAGPGVEVKVSLNLVETGEEILSDTDYLKMN